MKARVKASGEIVEVHTHDDADFQDRQGRFYWEHELYFGSLDARYDVPDYWTRLEHQAAISAMQGLIASNLDLLSHEIIEDAITYATALVEKYKKEERK